jgi:hypothetical protein
MFSKHRNTIRYVRLLEMWEGTVYCEWLFIVRGCLLCVAVYCEWLFIVSGCLMCVAVYCEWLFNVRGCLL